MSVPTLPSFPMSSSLIQRVRIHSELQIPAGCDSIAIYKSLKHTLQDSYGSTPWFHMKFRGFATQLWTFEARLHFGATMVHKKFRSKFRAQILDSFKANLSQEQFCLLQATFNRNRKVLQIEEDVAPFTEDKPHSWTRDGLPDVEDVAMNALLPASSWWSGRGVHSCSRRCDAADACLGPDWVFFDGRSPACRLRTGGWKQWSCCTAGIAAADRPAPAASGRVASCPG